jgi:hypothetical protein
MTIGLSVAKSALHADASINSRADACISSLHCVGFTPQVASSVRVISTNFLLASKNEEDVYLCQQVKPIIWIDRRTWSISENGRHFLKSSLVLRRAKKLAHDAVKLFEKPVSKGSGMLVVAARLESKADAALVGSSSERSAS